MESCSWITDMERVAMEDTDPQDGHVDQRQDRAEKGTSLETKSQLMLVIICTKSLGTEMS